jgi:hypothetical protein
MTFRNALLISAFATSAVAFGCGGSGTTNTSNANIANSNAAKANSNSPVAVNKAVRAETTNNAPTLTPVFMAYCQAMEKKDEAGIRKVYSKDTLESFAENMKAEKSKSLVDYLSSDNVSTKLCEIRNEVITGDTAVAEVRTEGMPNGVKVVFVKEGAEWKLTNRSPELDAVKQTATNTNSGK